MKNCCVAAFGEVMLRLCPPGKKRFAQSFPGSIEATFGGGEANVCASIAMLGGSSRYLSALPDNPVARAFAAQLRGMGCDVSRIHFDKVGRMGVYYAEHGSNMRGSNVVYDRDNSTISLLAPEAYDFGAMLDEQKKKRKEYAEEQARLEEERKLRKQRKSENARKKSRNGGNG